MTTLLNTVDESIAITFQDLGRPTDKCDDSLNYFIVSWLANGTRLDWIKHIGSSKLGQFPKYYELKLFIQQQIRSLKLANSRLF